MKNLDLNQFMVQEYIPRMQYFQQEVGYAAQFLLAKLDSIESTSEILAKQILEIGMRQLKSTAEFDFEKWSQTYQFNSIWRAEVTDYLIQNLNYQEFKVDPEELKIALQLMLYKSELTSQTESTSSMASIESKYENAWKAVDDKNFIQKYMPEIQNSKSNFRPWSFKLQSFRMLRTIFK